MKFMSIVTKHNKKKSVNLTKYHYPFDIEALTTAYISNPYHNQCIDLKTQNIVGEGLCDSIMDELEHLTPTVSAFTILHDTIKDLQIYGNAYWEIVGIGQIYHIPAQTMRLSEQGYEQVIGDKTINFAHNEVFHFKYSTPLSTIYGAPDYLPILPAVELYKKIITYNDNFFANNAIPDMAIIVKGGEMSPNALHTIRTFFRDKFQGVENAHKALYLPLKEGMDVDFHKLQADQKDASFMELLKQTITDIIACHSVPPRLISIVNQGSLGGGGEVAGQMDVFYKTSIKPKQKLISGLLYELNKKHKLFKSSDNFDFIPIEFHNNGNNDTFDSLLRRTSC